MVAQIAEKPPRPAGPAPSIPSLEVLDLYDILHKEYEPLQWIIPDYLPEGLTLFVARPKVGKSMTALALCLRMARRTNNGVDGEVLYLTLDDTSERRLQSRTRSLLQGNEIERGRIFVSKQSQSLDSGLIDQLEEWMRYHPATRLMVIDIYARVKPRLGDDLYKAEYDAAVKLQQFAVKHHIAIILIHHTNKRENTQHWMEKISGTTGLPGAVDTMWFVERKPHSNDLVLHVLGRDTMGEIMVELTLDDLDAPWQLVGEIGDDADVSFAQQILAELSKTDEALTPKDISDRTGIKRVTVRGTCRRLLHKDLVFQTPFGSYRVTPKCYTDAKNDHVVTLAQTQNNKADANRDASYANVTPIQSYMQKTCNSVTLAQDGEIEEVTPDDWKSSPRVVCPGCHRTGEGVGVTSPYHGVHIGYCQHCKRTWGEGDPPHAS